MRTGTTGMSPERARELGLWRLYGSEMSMFTAKVRPAFGRKGLRMVERPKPPSLASFPQKKDG